MRRAVSGNSRRSCFRSWRPRGRGLPVCSELCVCSARRMRVSPFCFFLRCFKKHIDFFLCVCYSIVFFQNNNLFFQNNNLLSIKSYKTDMNSSSNVLSYWEKNGVGFSDKTDFRLARPLADHDMTALENAPERMDLLLRGARRYLKKETSAISPEIERIP